MIFSAERGREEGRVAVVERVDERPVGGAAEHGPGALQQLLHQRQRTAADHERDRYSLPSPPVEMAHHGRIQLWLGLEHPLELVEDDDERAVGCQEAHVLQRRAPIGETQGSADQGADLGRQQVEVAAFLSLVGLEVDGAPVGEAAIEQVALADPPPHRFATHRFAALDACRG
jgi:hypothetical protein